MPGAAEGPVQGRSGRPGGEQPGVPVGPVDSGLMMLSGCALACLTMPSGSRTLTSTCELALGSVSEPSIRGVCEKDLSCTVLFFNMHFFVWARSSLQLVGSSALTRDQTWAPCTGSTESQLLDPQASPSCSVSAPALGSGIFDLRSSVQFSRSVMSDSLRPHESQHARLPCPSPTPGAYSNSCPLSR